MSILAWRARPFVFLAAGALAAVLSGCPPRRIDFGPRGRIDDPEALLELVAETEATVITLDGEAKVHVDAPGGKGAFSMFMALVRPTYVHLEPLDFFGRPQGVLVINEDHFGLYQAQDNRFYEGPATAANVARFLPLALPPAELVRVMLGAVPRIPHERAELVPDERCACYVLTLHHGAVTQRLEVHPSRYRVLKSEVTGMPAYDLELGDLDTIQGISFPRRITLRAPAAQVEVSLRYADVTLNKAPDLTMFDTSAPEGAEIVPLDAQGRTVSPATPAPAGPPLMPDAPNPASP
ncbi:MAG: DUF4292 domain-containing protein [Myxococcaceae bacterium]|nr:DUF4292 domain-containing protein [Myxococcaceae bacterium]